MKRILCVSAALVVLAAGAPLANATSPGTRTIAIKAHYDDNGALATPHTCSLTIPGFCQLRYGSFPKWSGTFVGTGSNDAYGSVDPMTQELHAIIWEYFPQVTVAGCGSGTMMWRGEATFTRAEQDPTTGGVVGHATWTYVKGSGTGDLARIKSGHFSSKHIVFKLPFFENHDDGIGSLVC
ncbi:MAG: hypothetical protein M3P04_06510 [Actinomycetota bacterium]|nr:hypothetical protein [Actinomycetota bacterium]